MKLKQIVVTMGLVVALVLPGMAFGHAVSIGYENAGVGSVNIWLGTYSTGHAALVNEGSMNLVGVLGNPFASTTVAFNLLAGVGAGLKPAGLVDGVTNFYAPNGNTSSPGNALPLVGSEAQFNAACPACGPVERWQGVTFSGLAAGSYQFTWVPIANPTLQWDILNLNMNGIFDLSGVVNPPTGVPEPSTLLLFGSGLAGLGFWRMRKDKV